MARMGPGRVGADGCSRPCGAHRPAEPSVDALAILEERFAPREIDKEQFERRRGVLRGRRATGGR